MKYGKYAPDGAVEQEADECILTGMFVDVENSIRERVAGTQFFYRIHGNVYRDVTEAQRDSFRADTRAFFAPVPEAPVRGRAQAASEKREE